ncbi:hypothetical protein NC653_037064 [Populus alba x Populus x berolinensis]|uniref:VPS37 C-terminal domain-containing protein n=1 Tax=Populus alba x Populus x berolinensis TaxID=444605 RepID=A0AAD6LLF5_9ROSI|nr:hypothetical protein NC653_037064 [Populus alba x Populus x berolinensis]
MSFARKLCQSCPVRGELMEKRSSRIMELRNQCRINSDKLSWLLLRKKLNELEKPRKKRLLRSCSPALHTAKATIEAMNNTEEESEAFHRQFLDKEIDLGAFVQKYKKLRTTYHKRALIHLAARASPTG